MNLSIKNKLALALSVFAALFLIAGGWLVYRQIKASFYHEFDERLRLQAMSLTTGIKQERSFVDVIFSDKYLREYDDDHSRSWFFQIWAPLPVDDVYRPKTMRSDSLKKNQNLPKRFGSLKEPVYWNFELPDGRSGRGIGIRYVPQADDHDRRRNFNPDLYVELVVAQDRSELDYALQAVAQSIGTTGGLGLLAAIAFVPLILTRLLRPLQTVSKQAEAIDVNTLSTRFETKVPSEIRPISQALNGLLNRLQNSFERERRFSSDIAHELRTPVAELKSYAELKIKWPDKTEGCFEQEVLDMSRRMESLVENLLQLARTENLDRASPTESVAAAAIVDECLARLKGTIESRCVEVHRNVADDWVIQTHSDLFRTIVINLLSNAIGHAPEKSEIHIVATMDPFVFSVRNSAPNLSRDDLPRMFDRLWQHDQARTHPGHHGLGLSLARSCAEALGMSLSACIDDKKDLILQLNIVANPQRHTRG